MQTSEALVVAGLVVQVILALAALWYTVETRLQRKHSTRQLRVLERQHLVAVAPFLLPSITPKAEFIKRLREDPASVINNSDDKQAQEARDRINQLSKDNSNMYLCVVNNPTSKIALQIDAVVYDTTTKNFATAGMTLAVIGEKDIGRLIVASPPMNQDEAITAASESYPEIESKGKDILGYDSKSYIVIFFRDIEQTPYAVKRAFELDEDMDCQMYASQIITLQS